MLATFVTLPCLPSSPRRQPSSRQGGRQAISRTLYFEIDGDWYYSDTKGNARLSSVAQEMLYRSECRRSGLESEARPGTAKVDP